MKETLRHSEAFEYYYTLGQGRSLKSVASQFKVDERSVARWSRNFNWQGRIVLRDIEIAKKLQEGTDKNILNTKADYRKEIQENLKIIRAGIQSALRIETDEVTGKRTVKLKFSADDVEELIKLIASYEKLVRLDLELTGATTFRGELEIKGIDILTKEILGNQELTETLLDILEKAKKSG
jgi:hypothetical protein